MLQLAAALAGTASARVASCSRPIRRDRGPVPDTAETVPFNAGSGGAPEDMLDATTFSLVQHG